MIFSKSNEKASDVDKRLEKIRMALRKKVEIKNEVDELKKKVDMLEELVNKNLSNNDIASLQQKIKELDDKILKFDAKIAEIKGRVDVLNTAFQNIELKFNEFKKSTLKEMENTLNLMVDNKISSKIENKFADIENKISKLQDQLKEVIDILEAL